jgi:hypothetical protein
VSHILGSINDLNSSIRSTCTTLESQLQVLDGQEALASQLRMLLETQLELALNTKGRSARIGVMHTERVWEVCEAAEDALVENTQLSAKAERKAANLLMQGLEAIGKNDKLAFDRCRKAFRLASRR